MLQPYVIQRGLFEQPVWREVTLIGKFVLEFSSTVSGSFWCAVINEHSISGPRSVLSDMSLCIQAAHQPSEPEQEALMVLDSVAFVCCKTCIHYQKKSAKIMP